MKLSSTFNKFLTSGVTLADPETIRRIRVLNAFETVFVLAAPLLAFFYYRIGAIFLFNVTLVAGLLGIAVIVLLRITRNPSIAGNLAVFILWATLVLIRWRTGAISTEGLTLLSWVWNATLILLAIFMTGYHWGTIWACLVFVETGFAVFLYQSGQQVINVIPADVSPVYSLGAYLLGLLAVLLFAFLFEKERQDTLARENEKSETLEGTRRYSENILHRSPIPTFVLDKSHRVVQWNRAAQEMTGIPSEEIVGRKVWDGFAEDEEGCLADKLLNNPDSVIEKCRGNILSLTESGSFAVKTFLPNLNGGQEAIVRTAPILGQDGTIRGAIQTVQDVNDSGAEGVSASEDKQHAIETRAHPAFKVDSEGKVSAWSKICEELFGFGSLQMLGRSPLSFVSKPHQADFRDAMLRALKGESVAQKDWKYYTLQGEAVHVLAEIYPVFSISGKVQECVVVNTDVTHLKQRIKRLERYTVESKERLRELTKEYDLLKSNIANFIRKKEE